jgi:hypothetical protein
LCGQEGPDARCRLGVEAGDSLEHPELTYRAGTKCQIFGPAARLSALAQLRI